MGAVDGAGMSGRPGAWLETVGADSSRNLLEQGRRGGSTWREGSQRRAFPLEAGLEGTSKEEPRVPGGGLEREGIGTAVQSRPSRVCG